MRVVDAVVVVDGRLLLDDLAAGAGAGHGRAEEDVDEEHDGEEDAKGHAQPQQPGVAAGTQAAGAVVHVGCAEDYSVISLYNYTVL